ncbi:MAG: hypothetical protein ABJO09_17260 [Hyphomicrobiales bacterium]
MRLFLLLASVFAFISLALVVSQHPRFVEQTRQLINPGTKSDTDSVNASGGWNSQFEHTSNIQMQQDTWQALSGFPSFTKLSFPLPRKTELVDGRLRLELYTQLAQSGVGSLRVAVNDERRAEIILNPGQEQRSLLLALRPEDLARNYVTVSLSAHGDAFIGACPSRPARGVVVDVLPSSGLDLAHAKPLEDPMDIWIANSRDARIPIGADTDKLRQADQLVLAARLRQAGLRSGFVGATTPNPVVEADDKEINSFTRLLINREQSEPLLYNRDEIILSLKDPNASRADIFGDENIQLADLIPGASNTSSVQQNSGIVDTSLQNFFRSNRWRLAYNLLDTDRGRAPSRLQLALNMAEQLPDAEWLVNVSLNDVLLSSSRLGNSDVPYINTVQLPGDLTQIRNEIVIDLRTTRDVSDFCDPGLEMTAQLLPDSGLQGVAFLTPEVPAYLIQTLAGGRAVSVLSEQPITLVQAAASADMLAHILPRQAIVNEPGADASEAIKIETLTKVDLEARLKELKVADSSKRFWIVTQETGQNTRQKIQIIPLTPEPSAHVSLMVAESSFFLLVEA